MFDFHEAVKQRSYDTGKTQIKMMMIIILISYGMNEKDFLFLTSKNGLKATKAAG